MSEIVRRLLSVFRKNGEPTLASNLECNISSYRERDTERNVDSSPPIDECIKLACAWGVEFYTPNHIENLIENFRILGWQAEHELSISKDPGAWLSQLRSHQPRIGRFHIGTIVTPDAKTSLSMDKYVANLPTCVEYATADLYSITPSLVSVVVCFVFKNETITAFDEALRKHRQTNVIPDGETLHIDYPLFQKRRHIRELRSKISFLFSGWFSDTLPGLYSSGRLLDRQMPTCEFVLLHKAEPFPSQTEKQTTYQQYLDILGMNHDYGVWESTNIEGLKYRIADLSGTSPQLHSVLSISETQLVSGTNVNDRESRLADIREVMPDLICLSSISPMLSSYGKYLNSVSEWPEFKPKSMRGREAKLKRFFTRIHHDSPARALENLRGHVAYSVDIAAVTSELAMRADKNRPLLIDIESFKSCDSKHAQKEWRLDKLLERSIAEKAAGLQETEKSIRDHLTQYGTLLEATQNVKTQRHITRLTWVLLAVAAVTLVTSLLQYFRQDAM